MKSSLKIAGVLVCIVALSACAATPNAVEQIVVRSQLDHGLVFERTTLADKQGTTTWDVVQEDGQVVKAVKHNKSSTAQQDMAVTVAGAVLPGVVNGAVAHSLRNRSSECGSGGCGGGQQLMQLQVQTTSGSVSEAAAGCPTCALLE